MSAGTIGVEPIGAGLRYLITRYETGSHAIVARQPGDRPAILGTGRDPQRLARAAAELALTYAAWYADHDVSRCWACCPPLVAVRGCQTCRSGAVPAMARVAGRLVPYWVHRITPERAHAARVGVA